MQDKYVGDVGDFGKYGLLNEIVKQSNGSVRLSINWYYNTVVETGNTDGRYIEYLNDEKKSNEKFKKCFPQLYEKMRMLVSQNKRSIVDVEANQVLPDSTIFYSEMIPVSGATPTDRINDREEWFKKSVSKLEQADIIFVDPDTGICLDPSMKKRRKAVKYVLPKEIETYFNMGKSLVIYNHRDMAPKQKYDKKILSNRKYVKATNDVQALKYKRVSVRHYIFVIQEHHRELISRTIDHLTRPPCYFLFEQYTAE